MSPLRFFIKQPQLVYSKNSIILITNWNYYTVLIVRIAKKSDKEEVLKFCTNTFEWGDYIDQVWDVWSADPHGKLYVVRSKNNNFPVAISHGTVCPGNRQIWVEGIRVHPAHRRKKIATALIAKTLQYGMQQGAIEASAVVATNNIGSRLMLEKNGFNVSLDGYITQVPSDPIVWAPQTQGLPLQQI